MKNLLCLFSLFLVFNTFAQDKTANNKKTYTGIVYVNAKDSKCKVSVKTENGKAFKYFCIKNLPAKYMVNGIWISFNITGKDTSEDNDCDDEDCAIDIESVRRVKEQK